MTRMFEEMSVARKYSASWIVVSLWLSTAVGCHFLRPSKDKLPEYDQAFRDIHAYEDSEGNYIRPEGRRAEKANSTMLPSIARKLPFIGDKPVDKERCLKLYAEAEAAFEEAKNARDTDRRDKFRTAAKLYKEAGSYWVSSAKEQDALLMTAESYYFAEDYAKAETYYAKLLKEYPRTRYSDFVDSRRMAIAVYWLKFNDVQPSSFYTVNFTDNRRPWTDTGGHGRRVLENIRLDNPTGELADDATMELANVAFKNGDYQTAADTYADLRMTYPDSPHQFLAHFLGLKSIMETYRGPEYDGGSLDEAEKIVKRIVRAFPAQAKEQQEYLNRSFGEIRYKKAERLWFQAQFRQNRGENNSASVYLNRILTEYSDTPFAERARTALEELKELPGEPVQRFSWLANLFPEHDKVKPLITDSTR